MYKIDSVIENIITNEIILILESSTDSDSDDRLVIPIRDHRFDISRFKDSNLPTPDLHLLFGVLSISPANLIKIQVSAKSPTNLFAIFKNPFFDRTYQFPITLYQTKMISIQFSIELTFEIDDKEIDTFRELYFHKMFKFLLVYFHIFISSNPEYDRIEERLISSIKGDFENNIYSSKNEMIRVVNDLAYCLHQGLYIDAVPDEFRDNPSITVDAVRNYLKRKLESWQPKNEFSEMKFDEFNKLFTEFIS